MLKKIAFALLATALAANAYAAATTITGPTAYAIGSDVSATLGTTGFNSSKNVQVVFASAASGGGADADVYAISSKHLQGDKIYGSTSASSYIWIKSSSSGTAIVSGDNPGIPNTPSDSSVTNGFSQM